MGRRHDLPSFAYFKGNAPKLRTLTKHWKIYHGEDGWVASGRLGQVWEFGVGKLGFTVTSGQMINKMIAAVIPPLNAEMEKPISHVRGQPRTYTS
jgi:hypothetical protein